LNKLEALAEIRLPHRGRIERAIQVIRLAPGEFAFRQGERQAAVHVVRSGLLKQYYTDADGNSWIKSFTPEGSAFACIEALESQSPVSFSSEAIEPSVVERIDYRTIQTLARESIQWQGATAAAYTLLARIKVRRERDLLMLTAEQLYERFVADSPELSERIPQKDLAGYLGVTAVGLNRIIKRCRSRS
jgi:CRP-like cAMP-binding protein